MSATVRTADAPDAAGVSESVSQPESAKSESLASLPPCAQGQKPMRADAKRNYDQLLIAASAAFQASGVDTSLEEIARQAGVGIGTLYRHFPTRNALIESVYRREVELMCARADELLRSEPAERALSEWMGGFVRHVAKKRGMATALKAAAAEAAEASGGSTAPGDSELFTYSRGLMYGAANRLLAAAVADGAIRADVDSQDLVRAMSGICLANDQPDWQDQAARLVNLLMDGLRFGATGVPATATDTASP
ncbi:TetR family transcriptional regulator [Jatrophihabitans sp. GAS493]|uniref:TetR/AcrR family transcriptional regulator n=1 Tax=Jatrophihabitans sp. GAS493 TaxID=1907575 RepID=UPI000BB6AE0E|nr:TetR/AcrR family transcriptional regulator [Jatrophihabitans sp. GAS493]SOD72063.1 TetR family transcriptional regulator [Jatrophihabitans sp. GAS493]